VLSKTFGIVQLVISAGVLALAVIICTVWFPATSILLWLFAAIGIVLCFWWWLSPKNALSRVILPSAMAAITVNLLLNAHAYPSLLKYQSGSELAKIADDENIPKDKVYCCKYSNYSFDFYFQQTPHFINVEEAEQLRKQGQQFSAIGGDDLMTMIKRENLPVKKVFSTSDYHITTLTTGFLNRHTREQAVTKIYLVEF